jgi:hypothetical protein
MAELTRKQQILLIEYGQAGEMCRNHDKLLRTGLVIFGAVQAAIIGFIGTQSESRLLELFLLQFLGFWLSVIVLLTTLRLAYRYASYMERAKCIERQLGMYLFECSQDFFSFENVPAKLFGNKRLWASVPFVTLWLYFLLLVRGGEKYGRSLFEWLAL